MHVANLSDAKWTKPTIAASKVLARRAREGRLTVLCGPRGVGKTHIAACLVRWWIGGEMGSAMYRTVVELMAQQRAWFDRKVTEWGTIPEPFAKAKDAGLLVIDDAHELGEATPWERVNLTEIVDKRYCNSRPTVLITNTKPDAIQAKLGASIVSRATEGEGGFISAANWPNRRGDR